MENVTPGGATVRTRAGWAEYVVRSGRPMLVATARRELGGNLADAEDVLSDVITDILAGRFDARFRLPADDFAVLAYTNGLTRNKARNRRRVEWRRAALDHEARAESPLHNYRVEVSRRVELGLDVARALARLTARESEFATLHWLKGATVPEIARLRGRKPKTVKEILRRARKKLVVRLK